MHKIAFSDFASEYYCVAAILTVLLHRTIFYQLHVIKFT